MKVYLNNGAYAEGAAELCCNECGTELLSSDSEPLAADDLIGMIQAHQYACGGVPVLSEGLWHQLCGTQLTHYRASPQVHRCSRCVRTITEAEQIRHEIQWAHYSTLNFRPGCVCGWESQHGHIMENAAQAEWARHTKAGR